MKLAKIYLIGFGLLSLVFGVGYLIAPLAMTEPAGFGALSASATTDVRATYGGFQIGIGAFLLWAAQSPDRLRGALWLVLLSIGSVFASRILGLLIDGELSDFHLSGLVVEFLLTTSAAYVLRQSSESSLQSSD